VVIEWGTVLYGAALTVVLVPLGPLALRERSLPVIGTCALTAACAAIAWNAVLIDAGAGGFFVDAPIAVIPVSWQDTGTGVWALALVSLILGLSVGRSHRPAEVARLAAASAFVAFLVDVYLY